jgi:S1-C subfamily serine protease
VSRAAALGALVLLATGCSVAAPSAPLERSELIGRILGSTVQLRTEREGGIQRAASGVILATDPARRRAWILTTRHFLDPPLAQQIYVRLPGSDTVVRGTAAFVSKDLDVAIVEADGLDATPIRLKPVARLGDPVIVVAFPWGQRFTVVNGAVSQLVAARGGTLVAGPPRMIDASVSYGSSGGGVFDARSGDLLGIVEGYRTVQVGIPEVRDRPLELPVAGETTLIPAAAIRHFLEDSALTQFLPR